MAVLGPTPKIPRIPSLVPISTRMGPCGRAHVTRDLDSRSPLWAKALFFLPLTNLVSIAVKAGPSVGGAAFLLRKGKGKWQPPWEAGTAWPPAHLRPPASPAFRMC